MPVCYLCQKNNIKIAFLKLGYKIFKCSDCGFHWLDFDYSYDQFAKNYYQEGYFKGDKDFRAYANYEDDKKIIQKNTQNYLNKILHIKKIGTLLDIGCALGFFLEICQTKGFETFGIDISEYAVKNAKKIIPNVVLGNISNSSFKKNFFDVITMFDLIEHLNDPRKDLLKVRSLLKDDGLLLIQTGDSGSVFAKILNKRLHFFAPPQHLFFFNQKNISEILKQSGFQVIKIEKDGKWVSLRYLLHMMGYSLNNGLWDKLYDLTNKNFLGKIPLYFRFNDNIVVYAKKSF